MASERSRQQVAVYLLLRSTSAASTVGCQQPNRIIQYDELSRGNYGESKYLFSTHVSWFRWLLLLPQNIRGGLRGVNRRARLRVARVLPADGQERWREAFCATLNVWK